MGKIRQKIAIFMQGRYGIDHIYLTNLVIYFIGLIFLRRIEQRLYLDILLLVLILWTFYRVFSRNIVKRQAENQVFLRVINKIKSTTKLIFKRIRDIGTHRYRRCPNCQTQLRLPRKVGTHTVKCPRCDNRFQVKIKI